MHIIIGLNVGGAELMLKRLVASHIDSEEYNHTVVSLGSVGPVGRQLQELGIEVIALQMNSFFHLPRVFIYLFRLIRNRRPDVVQTWMYHADLIGGCIARLAGCNKVIWNIRNTDLFYGKGVSKVTFVIMKLCAFLSRIIPSVIICVAQKAKLTHFNSGYFLNKMIVIPNGFDIKIFKPNLFASREIRQSLQISKDALVVGSIGRFNEYKDHYTFILAAKKVAEMHENTVFMLAGREVDSNNTDLMHWIEVSGNSENFVLLGEREDVPDILASMDIFCLHSKSEGFPNALGEAMSVGLPSVVTDVGDASILLGESGLIVAAQNVDDLTQGLLSMIKFSTEKRALLGDGARKRIHDKYSMDCIVSKYESLYKKVALGA
jgi:glycosyltransferase involved in cell wall biosynthesis